MRFKLSSATLVVGLGLMAVIMSAGRASAQGLFEQLFGIGPPKPAIVVTPRAQPPHGNLGGTAFAISPSRTTKSGLETTPPSGGTYRTICVRMCDGFFVPISFATRRDNFYLDQAKCQSTCGAEARLFYHRNPGEIVEDAVDLSGRAYSRLPNAFRFRKTRVEGCTCRPPPWSEAELARHQSYASTVSPKTANAPASLATASSDIKIAPADVASPASSQSEVVKAEATPPIKTVRLAPAAKKALRASQVRSHPSKNITVAGAPKLQAMAQNSPGGLFNLGGSNGMGLSTKPKYAWPGD